jgi:hypothetical protein
MNQVAAHGIGGAFIPRAAFFRLLRGKDVDEARVERIELEALLDVPVQRRGQELLQQEDAIEARVKAVADRDIDQAILARQRHRGLAAFLGEGKKARAATPSHDDGQNFF